MPPSGVDYASEFLNGYAPEYVSPIKFNCEYVILLMTTTPHIHKYDRSKEANTTLFFMLFSKCHE